MRRILVVDDEASSVSGLRTLLELDGYDVTATESSRRALELLAAGAFHAVITDLEMPEVGGTELVRAALAARSDTVVIVLTGYSASAPAADAQAAGARRVLDKPLDYDVLAAELRSVFGDP